MPINLFDPSEFGFPEGGAIFNYPPEARKAINEATMRIQGPQSYSRFWDRVLSDREREQLGNDLEACFQENRNCINLLCGLRGWVAERAVVEIAQKLGFLTGGDYQWLRGVAGDPVSEEASSSLASISPAPNWDRSTGRLELDGQLCRRIRVALAKKIVPVLDAFQEENWSPTVEYSNESPDPQQIHQVVRKLNVDLVGIRFGVQDQNMFWSPASS